MSGGGSLDGSAAPAGREGSSNLVPNQLAILVPTFDPAKDDLLDYSKKVQLLMNMWPEDKWTELATRLILGTTGTAFQKLQLSGTSVTANSKDSIKKIIEILGGQWGQIPLERKYEIAEKALYKCRQGSDESNDSYLARSDVIWQELLSRKLTLEDLQSYIILRGAGLSSEDKKRVILDSEASSDGRLTMTRVNAAVRMLGAGFFQEMTAGKKTGRYKTYDSNAFVMDHEMDDSQPAMMADGSEDWNEDEIVDTLVQEGDEDALLIADFESAVMDLVQSDEELAATYTAYTDARKRLNDKMKSRGFWPLGKKGAGKSKGAKGPKGKFHKGSNRKSLQSRILESQCKACLRMGHWKAECPYRNDASNSRPSQTPVQAPTSFTQVDVQVSDPAASALTLEFLELPNADRSTLDVSQQVVEASSFMTTTFVTSPKPQTQLAKTLQRWKQRYGNPVPCTDRNREVRSSTWMPPRGTEPNRSSTAAPVSEFSNPSCEAMTCFATHGTLGVVDLGATKTVIGSNQVQEFLNGIRPDIKSQIQRCKCEITFRFGNHGTLRSQHAMVVPIKGFKLKIAIVPGSTPFLLSNTLLRALGSVIDTERHELYARRVDLKIPLTLTSKGLFLLDLNDLAGQTEKISASTAETHSLIDTRAEQQHKACQPCVQQPGDVRDKPVQQVANEGIKVHQVIHEDQDQVAAVHQQHDAEHSRSKQKISEHVHPSGHSHVTVEASSGHSGARDAQEDGFLPTLHRGDGEHDDSIREQAPRQNIHGSLDPRSTMGSLVHTALRDLHETRTSDLLGVRESQSGEGRAQERMCADDVQGRSCQAAVHDRTSHTGSEELCNAQEQKSCSPIGVPSGHSRRSSWPLGRGRQQPVRIDSRAGRCGDSESSEHDQPSDAADGASHVPDGECAVADHPAPREQGCCSQQRPLNECPSLAFIQDAGDVSADCHYSGDFHSEHHHERKRFWKLIQQYTKELSECIQDSQDRETFPPKLTLLEVFCGPNSQLTHQTQQLGYRASRFGLAQGDLQTVSGRSHLFQLLVYGRPTNVWFSPTCGPWAGFSNLHGSKSLAAWDELQQTRNKHLEQIALGVVLLRHQRCHGRHFHWEQPLRSLMFRLPYLQEVLYYLLAVDVDLCTAGDLRDPLNHKPIQKSLTILTTSPELVQSLTGLRCHGKHDHQVIEGQTKHQGQWINRSTFTEHYPRKFARRIARCLSKLQVRKEAPYRHDQATAFALEHPESPPAKKARVTNPPKLKAVRACDISELPWGKRLRRTGKTAPVDHIQSWQNIFSRLENMMPRVGKRTIDDPHIRQEVQDLVPDMQIIGLRSCRGSNRTLDPPSNMLQGEAPFRRAIFIERGTGKLQAETEWENWEVLAKRNLIRPSHACKINLTVFAKEMSQPQDRTSSSQESPCQTENPDSASSQPPRLSVSTERAEMPSEITSVPAEDHRTKPRLTPSQEQDLTDVKQSERFRALPKDEQQMILRAHKNFGHPSPERLSTLLRSQGFRAEVAQAALDLRCSICNAQQQPKLARPSAIRDELDFNDRICTDMLSWTNKQGVQFHMCHIVDWATSFQTACVTPDQSTESVIQGMSQMWFAWAGVPQEMLIDAGTNFNSEEFSQFAQSCNIKVTTTSTEAPFQNGKAERHGAVLKTMLSKYEAEHPITSYSELKDALWWCIQAKNACSLRKGYAPEVLVLGKHTRIPGAVSSDELLPAHLLADSETSQGIQFRKQLACRESARRAFHQADNDSALRRAILRRSRPGQMAYKLGEWVMVWRQGRGTLPGYWSGPQKVVVHENAQTIWTTMTSKLFRSAPEHVRPVTASEATQIPLMPNEPSVSVIAQQLPINSDQGMTRAIDIPNTTPNIELPPPMNPPINIDRPESTSDQPDNEPEVPSIPPHTKKCLS